jgi:hypothetical protein
MKTKLLFTLAVIVCLYTQAQTTYFVNQATGNDTNDGLTWNTAYASLQQAIETTALSEGTNPGDQIWVAAGTYKPSARPRNFDRMELADVDKLNTFHLVDGVAFYGGFNGTETAINQRDISLNKTILSGDIGVVNDLNDNVYHVVVSVNDANNVILDGVVIKDAFTVLEFGVTLPAKTATNSNFSGPTDVSIEGTILDYSTGSAVLALNSNHEINNTIITNNFGLQHPSSGGVIIYGNSTASYNNVVLDNNTGSGSNNVNTSVLYANSTQPVTFNNITITNNDAPGLFANNNVSIYNSVFYNNTQDDLTTTVTGSNNFYEDGIVNSGFTELTVDPFTNIADADGIDNILGTTDDGLVPALGSVLVDAGDNSQNSLTKDIVGNTRTQGGDIDAGAYETIGLTMVPDDNFETYLETHDASGTVVAIGDPTSMGNGTNGDDLVFTSRIETVTNLDVSFKMIADLTGIEDFLALENLQAYFNQITSVSLVDNTALKNLNLGGNGSLSTINLSANDALEILSLSETDLAALDLSNNVNLIELSLNNQSNVNFTNIDLTNNVNLLSVFAYDSSHVVSIDVSNCLALKVLYVGGTPLTSLDVTANVALENLSFSGVFNSTNLTNNVALLELSINNSNLNSLILTANTALESLSFTSNSTLSSLDLTNNPALVALNVSNTVVNSLNTSANTALEELLIQSNAMLPALDLSANTALIEVDFFNNTFAELDFSTNINLELVEVRNHDNLVRLLIKNGENQSTMQSFTAQNNPVLACIEVDDVAYSTANWNINNSPNAVYNTNCPSTLIYVPDDVFENYLETHNANGTPVAIGHATSMGNGIADDNYVLIDRVNTVTNLGLYPEFDFYNPPVFIQDLTGIEGFIALEEIDLFVNVTSIDLTNNINLNSLYIGNNENPQPTTLNISANTELEYLGVYDINLSSINVTTLTKLIEFELSGAPNVTALDLTNNGLIENLQLYDIDINAVNLNVLPQLKVLSIGNLPITTIDLSTNNFLEELNIENSTISSVNVTNNLNLNTLGLTEIAIENIDLSVNTLLQSIYFEDNLDLVSINIKNGTNNPTLTSFGAYGNTSLQCIQVDNVNYSDTNTNWDKDAQAVYSTDCAATLTTDEFSVNTFEIYPNPASNLLHLNGLTQIETVSIFNVTGQKILDTKVSSTNSTIDVSQFSNGLYFLMMRDTTIKFIKE